MEIAKIPAISFFNQWILLPPMPVPGVRLVILKFLLTRDVPIATVRPMKHKAKALEVEVVAVSG